MNPTSLRTEPLPYISTYTHTQDAQAHTHPPTHRDTLLSEPSRATWALPPPQKGPNPVSVCFFLKMENHESPGEEGQEELRAGWWGLGACWVTWEKLQPLWTMGPSCPRCLLGLLEVQAGGLGQAC